MGSTMPAMDRRHASERGLLAYIVALVALLTLSPFRFAWPHAWEVMWWSDLHDAPANFLLFLPVGYFFRLTLARDYPRAALWALLFGFAVSTTVETLQLFLPRGASLTDVIANATGAAAGAILCNAVRRRLHRLLPSVLTLEHPSLNLVYLSLPLMLLTGVEVDPESERAWLLAPLGALGALVLTGLWRYRFSAAVQMPRLILAFAVFVWFLFGGITGLASSPHIVAQCAVGIFAFTLVLLYVRGAVKDYKGRFEHKVLATVWPCFLVYLAMLVLWPREEPFMPFYVGAAFPDIGHNRHITVRIAEQIAALTFLGYLIAESFGRSPLAPRKLFARNVAIASLGALMVEIGHGFLHGDMASIPRWLLGSLGAAFGVWLHAAQLSVVQILRGGAVLGAD